MVLDHFIELNRRFREIQEAVDIEEVAFHSYTSSLFGSEPGFSWDELLASRVVVILGEPGSGKTWEMRYRTKKMRSKGIPAFFVPLERLVGTPLSDSIFPEDEEKFQEWIQNNNEAIFFLDSVDEAKVRRQQDFAQSLDNFIRGIGISRRHRVRVVISARVSAWRGYADRDELLQRMHVPQPSKKRKEGNDHESENPPFRIVQLLPLDRERVRKFVESTKLENPDAFIEALDLHHAWEFAGRPIDVAVLINYWQERGRLGTLSELIEFDLDNKLSETRERRQEDPLTSQNTKEGAECLGASVLFCRRFSFLLPDTVPAENTSGAIDATACLPPDWTSTMIKAMLARAVFDVASYGRIRFHHRRVAEYLAARWLNERIREGCPFPVLEDLLFSYRNDGYIIRPSLRPVTAWMAVGEEKWNRRIRDRILSCAPDLFLAYGDPESLPSDYKRSILESLISRYSGRERIHAEVEEEALSRLADPNIASYVSAKVRDRTVPRDIRTLLLQLVRHGRLRDCLDAALQIISSSVESSVLKTYAVAAIRDVGDQTILHSLAEIALELSAIEKDLCIFLCEALYPRVINPQGLADLLRKIQGVPRDSIGPAWHLKNHLENELHKEQAADLLRQLVQLIQQPPHIKLNDKNTHISSKFHWLGELIPTVLIKLLGRNKLEADDVELAAKCLWLLGLLQHYEKFDHDLPEKLNKLLDQHPAVRRTYLWINIKEQRKKKPDKDPRLYSLFGYYEVVKEREADIDWLIHDIMQGKSPDIRLTGLILAIDLWYSYGCKRSTRIRIKHAIKKDRELRRLFKEKTSRALYVRMKRFFYHHGIYGVKPTVRRIQRKIEDRSQKLRDLIWLWRNLGKLRRGEASHALSVLAREAGEDHSHWGAKEWQQLIARRGVRIAIAAATGWKATWRQFTPLLPHEKPKPHETDNRVIIGLSGINVALADGELDLSKITTDEARLACRYAVNELNGFADWFQELAQHHPNPVREVLGECIRGELQIPTERESVHDVIRSIHYHGRWATPLVGETILNELKTGDPLHVHVLEDALSVLLTLPDQFRLSITHLAAQRAPCQPIEDSRFSIWMIVWLQLEADTAMNFLQTTLVQVVNPYDLMVRICSGLNARDNRGGLLISNPDYLRSAVLREMIPLVYRYVLVEDDINRFGTGAYSPTPRDHAQDFRNSLFERLGQLPDSEADDVLRVFAEDPLFQRKRDWILHLIDRRAEMASDAPPWEPAHIRDFINEHETDPRSNYDLYKIACKRFIDIKDEVERGDISARYDLHPEDKEPRLRSWLARQLRALSKGRYTVPQEEEIDLEQRPDLRIEAPGIGPVSIEIKWADNWTARQLKEGLTDQLVGKYLRAPNSNYGIYVLGYKKRRNYWKDPTTRKRLYFEDLVGKLKAIAEALSQERDNIDGLKVFGINFSRPPWEKRGQSVNE